MTSFDSIITDGIHREISGRIFSESTENGLLGTNGYDMPNLDFPSLTSDNVFKGYGKMLLINDYYTPN